MKIFKNICAGTGLLAIVLGALFFLLWLIYSIGRTGAVALAFSIVSIINYLR